jgi:hypothetical protein
MERDLWMTHCTSNTQKRIHAHDIHVPIVLECPQMPHASSRTSMMGRFQHSQREATRAIKHISFLSICQD